MTKSSHEQIEAQGEAIVQAASLLIGMVRVAEHCEGGRSNGAQLSIEIGLTEGGTETWEITIERTASSH